MGRKKGRRARARYYPEEVIIEILSWLPVKSLMRFKSVSKPWCHLITNNPRFKKLHFNRSIQTNPNPNPNPGILVSHMRKNFSRTTLYYAQDHTSLDKLTRFEIPFFWPRYTCHKLINVCNGLVCLINYREPPPSGGGWCSFNNLIRETDDYNAYVWNPLTGYYITLDIPPFPSCFHRFPYDNCTLIFGFGFIQATDQYKLVRLVSVPASKVVNGGDTQVSVYTLARKSSSWRTLQQFVPYSFTPNSSSTALVNGSLHLFGTKLSNSDENEMDTTHTLVAFNMQDEIFEEIPNPPGVTYEHPFYTSVGELTGLLSIFCTLQHKYVDIWVMEEYGVADSWRRLFKIEQPEVSIEWTPFSMTENGEVILSKNTREWILYDSKTNSVRDLHRFEFPVCDKYTFKGSLLSPRTTNRSNRRGYMID